MWDYINGYFVRSVSIVIVNIKVFLMIKQKYKPNLIFRVLHTFDVWKSKLGSENDKIEGDKERV